MILKHNHRQGEENTWADVLNQFREGIVSEEGKALLRERCTTEEFLDEEAMHIIYTRVDVKDHNNKMLNVLPSQLVSIKAGQALPKGAKSTIDPKSGTIGKTQFLDVLNIKIGARVVVIHNVNVIDDLVNGSYGKVIGIEQKEEAGRGSSNYSEVT